MITAMTIGVSKAGLLPITNSARLKTGRWRCSPLWLALCLLPATGGAVAQAPHGMVASVHPVATEAGLAVLDTGHVPML